MDRRNMTRMTDEEFFALPDRDPSAPAVESAFGLAVTKEEGEPLYFRDGAYWVLQTGPDGTPYRAVSHHALAWRP